MKSVPHASFHAATTRLRIGALALIAVGGFTASAAISARAATPAGVPVLMYHRVDAVVPNDAVGRDLTVEPAAFDAQLKWLAAHHIRTITAAALADELARGEHPQHVVVLTFDDGYDDAATTALPILVRDHAVGTFYVSSGFVGTPRHLTWRQMREMKRAGMEVACHGTNHLDLSTLDRKGQEAEASGCTKRFAHYLGGVAPTTYAYPAGQYDATTFAVMHELGIRAAFTEHPGDVTSFAQPLALPRLRVRHDDTVAQFGSVATP